MCNELDVNVIRDWNIGFPEYWGAVGHYTIAGKAIDLLADGPLKNWMNANRDLITYPTAKVIDKNMKGLSKLPFVPLADVPDMVWKVGDHKRGGQNSPEHPNHFADMDQPRPGDKKTLLELCDSDPDQYVTVREWQTYYDAVKDKSRGLLPFRVWQIWDAMAGARDIESFVCAAGIVAHYVGDSCQPLHISYCFNGDPDHKVPAPAKGSHSGDGEVPAGTGVHSAYEDGMVNAHISDINQGLESSGHRPALPQVASGHDAAKAVVKLMKSTFDAIKPMDIVNKYIALQKKHLKPRQIADALWTEFGDDTVTIMRDGAWFLALVWQSAWDAGNRGAMGSPKLLPQQSMIDLYTNPNFLPSHTIDTIQPLLDAGPHASTSPAPVRTRKGP